MVVLADASPLFWCQYQLEVSKQQRLPLYALDQDQQAFMKSSLHCNNNPHIALTLDQHLGSTLSLTLVNFA